MNTADRFRQIRNLFDAALDRAPEDRASFLDEACSGDAQLWKDVDDLLCACDRPPAWLDSGAVPGPRRLEGRRIGAYHILRLLGEGGMGSVYLAARADGAYQKQVAIKIVRPEMGSAEVLQRFQQERQVLASLDHPNIARLLDGGVTDEGLPYLVMEYVDGKPIDLYCDEHRLGIEARLRLFEDVCAAVRHAHSKQVVHRDLKPSNILVTGEGLVKLLDFGIAKLGEPVGDETVVMTRSDLRLMTAEYASPEQVRGEPVTGLADIYALGVILYELLTGRRPYRLRSRAYHEIARIICEEPPTRPSTAVTDRSHAAEGEHAREALSWARGSSPDELRRQLAGNLDGILLKALEKEPMARYRSALELSQDVRRHLNGEPVEAGAYSHMAVIRRFAGRYSGWLIAGALLGLAIAKGVIVVPQSMLLVVAAALAGIGFGVYVLSREVGRPQALRLWKPGLRVMAAAALVQAVLHTFLPSRNALTFVGCVLTAILLYQLVRWPFREMWLGPMLIDVTRTRSRLILIPVIAGFGVFVAASITHFSPEQLVIPTMVALNSVFILLIAHRSEVRQQGITVQGSFLRWNEISSYSWDPERGTYDVLRIRARGWMGLFPWRMMVKPDLRPRVEEALRRQLMDWPSPLAESGARPGGTG